MKKRAVFRTAILMLFCFVLSGCGNTFFGRKKAEPTMETQESQAERLPKEAIELYPGTEYPAKEQTRFLRLDNEEDFYQVVLIQRISDVRNWTILSRSGSVEKAILRGDRWVTFYKDQPVLLQMSFHEDGPEYLLRFRDFSDRSYSYVFRRDPVKDEIYLEEEQEEQEEQDEKQAEERKES